jgi:putative YjhG/YagF family dehydratase
MSESIPLDDVLGGDDPGIYDVRTCAPGPSGKLPLSAEMLAAAPSGDVFGWTQDVGMGWRPEALGANEFLILSSQGGLRDANGRPIALGLHTGHWELGALVEAAARELGRLGATPFAACCSDPCDGRTQGTSGMMDSLAYRNDAAIVLRRLIRSLPTRKGVLGIATCDKGLPAMMMALAAMRDLPCVLVPGGVMLPPTDGEDAGLIQSIGARFARGEASLEYAREMGCRACASPGGGCQFLGTAATSQVVGEALGLSLPHAALAPSGQEIWLDVARRSARAVARLESKGLKGRDILTESALRNAMIVHAAFGGSTNLLLHLPAIAHAAGLPRPTVEDWRDVNLGTPRLVDVLPNGPVGHPTVRVFLAGGVPEVMLRLRDLGLLDLDVMTVAGESLGALLDWWKSSPRRQRLRTLLKERDGVEPDEVIFSPERARERGLAGTVAFPSGNLAPEGSVVKTAAIDPTLLDSDGVYHKTGPARVFVSEQEAIRAIKEGRVKEGDVLVLCCCGPLGSGMEETYQITSALKHMDWGKHVALVTDARFSGFSAGACIGHVGPEALAGGPIGKVIDGDIIEIALDCRRLTGSVNLVGHDRERFTAAQGERALCERTLRPDLSPRKDLPDDTRLWAALQGLGGGAWGGCVYDVDSIVQALSMKQDF